MSVLVGTHVVVRLEIEEAMDPENCTRSVSPCRRLDERCFFFRREFRVF